MRELGEHAEAIHIAFAEYILEKIPKERDVAFFLVGPLMEKYVLPRISLVYLSYFSLSSRAL